MYELLFDDGYTKRCSPKDMSKIKRSAAATPVPTAVSTSVGSTAAGSTAAGVTVTPHATKTPVGRKINPPLPIPKFDLEALNLLPVPKDGEWCCNWVNDTPIGAEGYLEGPDGHRRPTVLVEDWRLPAEWTKHLYQRSSVSGKWDVVLVGPTKKRFRSKNDVKVFLEERGESYNPDIYDFSIHKRRAKDLGLFVFTDDYKDALKQKQIQQAESAKAAEMAAAEVTAQEIPNSSSLAMATPLASSNLNISNISSEDVFQGFSPPDSHFLPSDVTVPSAEMPANILSTSNTTSDAPASAITNAITTSTNTISTSTTKTTTISENQLEEGFVYVGALKVQLIDNLFRCPDQQCNKNFRKENHLQIHIKHYHDDLAKLMGVCPKMSDLAYLRTMGQPTEEVTPKNQIPNAQFFEKVYQSELTSKAHRKSISSPIGGKTYTAPKTPVSSDDGTPSLMVTNSDTQIAMEPPANVIASPPTIKPEDDSLDKKMTKIEEVLNNQDTSFEQTFIMQECIGGYTKPPMSSLPSIPPCDLTDAEALIETHAVSRPTSKSGRPRKIAKSSKSKIKIKLKNPLPRPYNKPGPKPQNKLKKKLSAAGKFLNRPKQDKVGLGTASTSTSKRIHDYNDYKKQSFGAEFSTPPQPTPQTQPTPTVLQTSKSNRLKYIPHRPSMDLVVAPIDKVAVGGEIDFNSPRYINENGEMIKIVRMRQEEIISCICNYAEEDGLMIQCELCLCWQHGFCHGIDRENQVPEKYVCDICKNPRRGRPSMKYVHDQDWLYEGRLPVAKYHNQNPKHTERFEMLKQSHTLTGNLLELKRFMHSLKVKINIAENKDHPKMYLWSRKWEKSSSNNELCGIEPLTTANRRQVADSNEHVPYIGNNINLMINQTAKKIDIVKAEIASPLCATPSNNEKSTAAVTSGKPITDTTPPTMLGDNTAAAIKEESIQVTSDETKLLSPGEIDGSILAGLLASPGGTNIDLVGSVVADCKQERTPTGAQVVHSSMNVPQPEAAIDPVECQIRLLEHIQKQQALAMQRLQTIETQITGTVSDS